MILYKTLPRFFHSSVKLMAVEKSLLASLRKKTGYSFVNCKKALEMHNNDLTQAEKWLRDQAQALGWSKATKLEGRKTANGLIGVAVDNKDGVLLEVNCETDFVARNAEFQALVTEATKTCLNFIKSHNTDSSILKVSLEKEQLKNLKTQDGKSLADLLALMIGSVGENASLKRALCVKVPQHLELSGYAHPSTSNTNSILLGRLGTIVAFKNCGADNEKLAEIGKGICQHIVGMHPKKIGSDEVKPAENKEEETCLIHQSYLFDDSVTVKEVLEENQVEVVDFRRFECGEEEQGLVDQPLDLVETCQ